MNRSKRKLNDTPVAEDVNSKANRSNRLAVANGIDNKLAIRFVISEIVWCKLSGFHHWPAKILRFEGKKIVVFWYNDYRQSSVFLSQLFPFEKYCLLFSKNVSIALGTAIKEALIELKCTQ